MSQELPAHANLEHLRKQAKALLGRLRQNDATLQLSDAQLALAREYGFRSWPALKARIDASSGATKTEQHPMSGRWLPDLRRSTPHPDSPFVGAEIEIEVAENVVVVKHVAIDGEGREERGTNTLIADGTDWERANGYCLNTKWIAPNALVFVARRHGEVVGEGAYEVSEDGETLTISGPEQRIVCQRTA